MTWVLWVFWTSPAWQPQCHLIPIIWSSTSCPELSHVRVCHWWAPSTSEACLELEVFSWTKSSSTKMYEILKHISTFWIFLVHPDQLSFAVDVQLCPFWRKLIGATLVFYVCSKHSNNIRQLAYFHLVHSFPTHNRTKMLLLREFFWKGRPCSSRCWKSALAMAKASIRLMGSWCESVRISCRGDKLVVYLTYILHGKLAYPNEQRDKNTIWAGLLQ